MASHEVLNDRHNKKLHCAIWYILQALGDHFTNLNGARTLLFVPRRLWVD